MTGVRVPPGMHVGVRPEESTFDPSVYPRIVGDHPTWNLRLDPWGTRTDTTDVAVPRALYDQVQPGDPVCVWLGRGALAIAWYVVGRCR